MRGYVVTGGVCGGGRVSVVTEGVCGDGMGQR